jgi:hypothetical protein
MQTETKKQRGGARPGAGRKPGEPVRKANMWLPVAQLDEIEAMGEPYTQFYIQAAREKLLRDKALPSQ